MLKPLRKYKDWLLRSGKMKCLNLEGSKRLRMKCLMIHAVTWQKMRSEVESTFTPCGLFVALNLGAEGKFRTSAFTIYDHTFIFCTGWSEVYKVISYHVPLNDLRDDDMRIEIDMAAHSPKLIFDHFKD